MNSIRNRRIRTQLLATTIAASANVFAKAPQDVAGMRELVLTLNITAAADGSSDATYDVYVTNSDGVGEWDIVHFPQIAAAITTTPKTFVARVMAERLAEVTTAGPPGVAAEPTAILETETAGSAQGAKTLAAGKVRHGPFADQLGVWIVISGTLPSITFTLDVTGS